MYEIVQDHKRKHEAMTSCGFGTCLSMCMGFRVEGVNRV